MEEEEQGEGNSKQKMMNNYRLAQQAAVGLNMLHSGASSVVHRDVKSLNYMVSLDGNEVKLIDFGMSKAVHHVSTTAREGSFSLLFLSYCLLHDPETNVHVFSNRNSQVGSARDVQLPSSVDGQGGYL